MSPAVNIGRVTYPPMVRSIALPTLVMVLTLTGCSNAYQDVPEAQAAQIGATSDINPRDPATLRDGGNLRLPLTMFPDNFNVLNIDGNTGDTASVVGPTLPGVFLTGADGTLVNDRTGAVVLSENAGAHEELAEWTITVNPFDVEEQAHAIHAALSLSADERRRRLDAIRAHVHAHDINAWIDVQLAALDGLRASLQR